MDLLEFTTTTETTFEAEGDVPLWAAIAVAVAAIWQTARFATKWVIARR